QNSRKICLRRLIRVRPPRWSERSPKALHSREKARARRRRAGSRSDPTDLIGMSGAATPERKGRRAVPPRSDNSRNTRGHVQTDAALEPRPLRWETKPARPVGVGLTQHEEDIFWQMPVWRASPRAQASHVGRIIESEIGTRYCRQSRATLTAQSFEQ